jgi:hypothetical protein
MPSPKALDLLRDPRLVVHSVTCNREGTDGDIKLYGRAVAIDDPDLRTAYRAAIKARIDWEPEEGTYHLFALDVQAGGYVRFEGEHTRRCGRGTRPGGSARTAARPWRSADRVQASPRAPRKPHPTIPPSGDALTRDRRLPSQPDDKANTDGPG